MLPFVILYLADLGLSFKAIAILGIVFYLSWSVLEIPAGVFADFSGRKPAVLIGAWMKPFIIFGVMLANDFWHLIVLYIAWGGANALTSGAKDAWVADYLRQKGRRNLLHTFYIKNIVLENCGWITAGVLGSLFVALGGYAACWLAESILVGLSALAFTLATLRIKETRFQPEEEVTIPERFLQGGRYLMNHPQLRWFIAGSVFLMLIGIHINAWQPYFRSLQVPTTYLGLIFSTSAVVSLVAPFFSQTLLRSVKTERNYLVITTSLYLIPFFLIPFSKAVWAGILFYTCVFVIRDFSRPVENLYLQRHVPSSLRASALSAVGSICGLAILLSEFIGGILLDSIGPGWTVFCASLFVCPALFCFMALKPDKPEAGKQGLENPLEWTDAFEDKHTYS
jgi:MFS family permease